MLRRYGLVDEPVRLPVHLPVRWPFGSRKRETSGRIGSRHRALAIEVDDARGQVVRLAPPLCITPAEVDQLVDIVAASIGELESELT